MSTRIDKGWSSRKLQFGIISTLLVFAGWLATGIWVALAPSYVTMVGGLTGLYALFVGANIGNKFVVGKTNVEMKKAEGPPVEPSAEEPTEASPESSG